MKKPIIAFSSRMFARRFLAFVGGVFLVLIAVGAGRSQTTNSGFVCPVTQAPQPSFTPTGVSPQLGKDGFYFGTQKLSLLLLQPWYEHETKIPWFSDDAHYPNPVNLTATGRRLDGASPPPEFHGPNIARSIQRDGSTGVDFITTSMKFPATGCWEITARMNNTELKFVTNVLPGDQR